MIGDAAADKISKAIGQMKDVTREMVQAEKKDDAVGFDLEVSLLCERIGEQLGDLKSLFPTSTKEDQQRLIPILQSICRNTMRFCASHGQPVTELEELGCSNKEEQGQAKAVVAGGEFSIGTAREHQRSPTVDVKATKTNPSDDTEDLDDDKPDAAYEEEAFARYREGWERFYGDSNTFEDLTLFSPMLFTHCTPGFIPEDAVPAKTVQICSIKIARMEHFNWPLEVYGVVAARDAVDNRRRNPLFLRPRDDCQVVDEKDPFLHLTGPVRAIVSEEPVDIDIQLIIKGATASEDRALISYAFYYRGDDGSRVRTSTIEKYSCTLELCTQQIYRSVQATIFGVHVVDDMSMPFENGFKVVCSSLSQSIDNESPEVVLFDSKLGRKCRVKNGFLNLSRQVIPVEKRGKMKVMIQAYSQSGDVAVEGHVLVVPKNCNTSQHELDLGGFKVVFTVAWSLLVEDEESILMNGMVDPYALLPPMPPSLLKENLGIF